MGDILKDERFAHIGSDPRFKRPSKASRKVKIDKRFQSIFSDKRFQVKCTVDKRGRPVNESSSENYRRYYDLSSDEDDDEDEDGEENEDESEEGSDKDSETNDSRLSKVGKKKATREKETKPKVRDGSKKVEVRKKKAKKSVEIKGQELSDDDDEDNEDDHQSLKKLKEKRTKGKKALVSKEEEESSVDEKYEDDRFENNFEDSEDESEDDDEEGGEEEEEESDDVDEEVKAAALNSVSQRRRLPKEMKDKLRDLTQDYARGKGTLMTDSSSSSEDESDEAVDAKGEEEFEHDWGELDKDAGRTDSATERIAICNMDWDRIRAVDLMVLCSSFLPPGGVIKSVTVYPSEFGMQRMKEEEERGPIELVERKRPEKELDLEDEEGGDEEGQKYHMERLRKYQLTRLKYYYAVVVCDSIDTASTLYNECDGLEYESSATILDLRFIPDDVTFDQEPREVCTKLPDIKTYQPRLFLNTALQQGKVECTWDETDPERMQLAQKLQQSKGGDEVNEKDLQLFLASSSSSEGEENDAEEAGAGNGSRKNVHKNEKGKSDSDDDDDDDDDDDEDDDDDSAGGDGKVGKNSIDKYRSLLLKIEEDREKKKNRDVEMEITWGVGLKEKTQSLVEKRLKKTEELTPFEKLVEKKKEKRRTRKQEKVNGRKEAADGDSEEDTDSEGGGNEAFSDDEIPDGIDMDDEYFKEEFEDTGITKKKTKNLGRKKRGDKDVEDEESTQKASELELLLMDEEDGGLQKQHFSLKKIIEKDGESGKKKKKKKGRKQLIKNKKKLEEPKFEDDFKVNVADDRFNALYSSHHFNIDPADSHFHKTKGMEAFVHEKISRKVREDNTVDEGPSKKKSKVVDTELSKMVSSIKRNTQQSRDKR